MPFSGVEICRQRLTHTHFVRAALLAENYVPETAVRAGFLDQAVVAEDLLKESLSLAEQFSKLDMKSHHETKLRARRQMLKALKRAIRSDRSDFIVKGTRRVFEKILNR